MNRKLRQILEIGYRLATASRRPLPDFLVIGAQKAGTTALMYYLRQHPSIFKGETKNELHFFDRWYSRGERWYRAAFPRTRALPQGSIVGEGTPEYLLHPHAPKRIAALLPDVKLIAVLRDPAKRALSHYQMELRNGRETLSFEEALAQEDARIGPEWDSLLSDERHSFKKYQRHAYKARGRYVEQLQRFFEHVPRERILILNSRDLSTDTKRIVNEVCEFLEISHMPETFDMSHRNVGEKKQARPVEVPEGVMEDLREYFRPYNAELYSLLDRDFGW
ncbi:MAG: sulfotransferase domain-containing protein [Spirochaetales bacterium]|nr:sulfotransferase domain-containing protein [Spirochaetales bacterium]